MCGIFSLLFKNNTLGHDTIIKSFSKGKNRGPEFSHIEIINGSTDENNKLNIYFGFHRLAINGLDSISNQPFHIDKISLICNGEIYNYKELFQLLNIQPVTNSDCEIIIHLYKKYGISYTLQILDGVFAFVLYDHEKKLYISARDPYGVRPLYMLKHQKSVFKDIIYGFSSELKSLIDLMESKSSATYQEIQQFIPGTFTIISENMFSSWNVKENFVRYTHPSFGNIYPLNNQTIDLNNEENNIFDNIRHYLETAIEKRVQTTERPIACLLSGGLDSSLICSLVSKQVMKLQGKKIETFSIGLADSDDLYYARIVAKFLNTNHHEIIVTEEDFLKAIPEVIYKIESYDTTTIRASVGNYLVSKYISENSEAKVIFNGDGADELMGGYLYFHKSPDPLEFDKECRRLLKDIYMFDVLRSDKSISSCGLEPRTPFLDREFVQYYLSISPVLRCHNIHNVCEKYILRKTYHDTNTLPNEVLWRTKEAFSDGVSKQTRSWFQIIQEYVDNIIVTTSDNVNTEECVYHNNMPIYKSYDKFLYNKPTTKEQLYYRSIFNYYYPKCDTILPYFWMPKYVNAVDSSARTLNIYRNKNLIKNATKDESNELQL